MLTNKTVVLGITGGIAAYKAADLASKLTQAGAKVETIMTESATKFITPLTLRNISDRPVVTDMFELASEFKVEHVALADAADVVVIAPATANIIAKIAAGIADDMLTCVVLATKAPIIVAPSMDANMWQNSITQQNVNKLKGRGFTIIEPRFGYLASGKTGMGRLAETEKIVGTIKQVLGRSGDLAARRIVVTAGGTQEPIDPVRHISNRSSGKMGYAIAEAARDRGAVVALIAAPTSLPDPAGIDVIHVETAAQMKEAVEKAVAQADALIMAAAVADYQPKTAAKAKIKRKTASLTLELVRTPDILGEVKGKFLRVGFAAESENLVENARKKLEKKQLDLIVANDITDLSCTFGSDNNKVTIIDRKGKAEDLPLMSKREVAERILERVGRLLGKKFDKEEQVMTRVEITLRPRSTASRIIGTYIIIPEDKRHLFPNVGGVITIKLETGDNIQRPIRTHNEGKTIHFHLPPWWFKRHRDLKPRDKLVFDVLKPEGEYHLVLIPQ
ncbi:MAG: bifunctional phosphopantothenoylcysteine decarboxylase/phosphopantothenate--cysteine ligase CoaBC [Chloroflexi bacterium]|nr:bifunctional phosphopantothenoylcysteine decarboxylase/phosphopantothenate--cysteine ligase CoaBC [Chloroflexota bacterium]